MPKIVIATPVGKDCQIDIRTASYCSTESQHPDIQWAFSPSRAAECGRNTLISGILEDKNVTHIFFLDSDVVPTIGDLWKLYKLNVDVAAGIYPLRIDNVSMWDFKVNGEWYPKEKQLPNTLVSTNAIGGSTVLVRREVFEKIGYPWYQTIWQEMDSERRTILIGEDIFFCNRVIECGYKIIVDPTVICKHYNYTEI